MEPRGAAFTLVRSRSAAPIAVSGHDYPGVVRAVGDLQADIKRVTGVQPAGFDEKVPPGRDVVIIGTIGHSPLIDDLVAAKKLDVSGIEGKRETSLQQVVQNPIPGVRAAFVIAGSDQRGTIFGIYDVSRKIGVSPWYWWDDVVPTHQDALYVLPGSYTQGTPVVEYRGFFINDENPALGEWVPGMFGEGKAPGYPGGFNHDFYAKTFELALRLKANYVWPAVWGRAFEEDDPQNQATATAYGIVMGTSHEAPMMRGIEEWNRHAVAAVRDSSGNITTAGHDAYGGTGEWSFVRNAEAIKAYWTDGIKRMVQEKAEGVVTLGMRGNGDTALSDGAGSELMTSIISTQRQILADVTGKDVTTIPQVWTLYKEVLRYWDNGLRPPEDVTVVFTDDNWGNIPQLPDQSLPVRSGGHGLYYHFDYVGGGRNYKWVDTTSIQNTWDQLHQAYRYGDSRLWMANVGDVKNNEESLQFFLDYAWNPNAISLEGIGDWERQYAAENFGSGQAAPIAAVLNAYGQLQSRRKPELLNRKITLDPTKNLATDSSAVVYDDQATPFRPHPLPGARPRDDRLAATGSQNRGHRSAASREQTGRLLRARALRGEGDRKSVCAAQRGVHEHHVCRARSCADQPARRHGRGEIRRRPGNVGLLQQRPRRREVEGIPDPAAHRLWRCGPLRPQRPMAAARAEQRRPVGRDLPRSQAHPAPEQC